MSLSSPPRFPSSFDPAIHLHSEQDRHRDAPLLTSSHSDEFEALRQQLSESTAAKNKQGIVIQHRAWKVPEAFRSEEDHAVGELALHNMARADTPSKHRVRLHLAPVGEIELPQCADGPPSSPPTLTMPFMSSPVAYPATSSPTLDSPRKRRKVEAHRSSLHSLSANSTTRLVGGFLAGDSDDEEDSAASGKVPLGGKAVSTVEAVQPTCQVEAQVENGDMLSTTVEEHVGSMHDAEQEFPHGNTIDAPVYPDFSQDLPQPARKPLSITTTSGKTFSIGQRHVAPTTSYEQLIAARSTTAPSGARKSYYGIDIHQLMDDAAREAEETALARQRSADAPVLSVEESVATHHHTKPRRTLMWTEKYRARKFTDLIGDERTHRSVLRWLKGWDPIVFPGSGRPKPKASKYQADDDDERVHRKILLLAGPPGLGKTTLAHVCAKQAGYEVQEINASDERSRDVVKGRIRDMVGTENVRGVDTKTSDGTVRKAGRPVCVVVDEVDGVVTGASGGGEGGFIKALIDLVTLDSKNSQASASSSTTSTSSRKRKGDRFRLLRPLILICNDLYHPSLRPLRQSSIAEVIHIRKPPLNMVVSRMHSIFEKEGVPCDADGVRRLCEATWGVSTRKEGGSGSGTAEGDIRGVMVIGEWVASKLRASINSCLPGTARLTRRWIEEHLLGDLADGGGAARSLGRGGVKEVVERIFLEGAGFPRGAVPVQSQKLDEKSSGPVGVAEASKRRAMERIREMVDTSGECERVITDCFTLYPTRPYQDDTLLSKPNTAHDWLHFHDSLSSAVYGSQEWELAAYLSQSVLAFHHLFASPATAHNTTNTAYTSKPRPGDAATADADASAPPHPFTGAGAPFAAAEAQKQNRAALHALQSALPLPLARTYRAPEQVATELLPYVLRMLAPDVKPVLVNTATSSSSSSSSSAAGDRGPGRGPGSTASVRRASEKQLVARAVNCMAATGVRFERARVEGERAGPRTGTAAGGWVYRMEPPLDALGAFETAGWRRDDRVRYAVRQVLEMEWARERKRREEEARKRRVEEGGEGVEGKGGGKEVGEDLVRKSRAGGGVKRDFFGRAVEQMLPHSDEPGKDGASGSDAAARKKPRVAAASEEEGRVWVSFNEGYSNAVRKPVTLEELMRGL